MLLEVGENDFLCKKRKKDRQRKRERLSKQKSKYSSYRKICQLLTVGHVQ